MMYDGDNRIYHYDALLLKGFCMKFQGDLGEYYQIIFNDETKILNDEMLTTIEKFFENS